MSDAATAADDSAAPQALHAIAEYACVPNLRDTLFSALHDEFDSVCVPLVCYSVVCPRSVAGRVGLYFPRDLIIVASSHQPWLHFFTDRFTRGSSATFYPNQIATCP